ncbi:ribonuclease P protein subunit p29 [Hydra vulgaris]|uniref:Ribonuclease P protein subunit p29 n=1 Tax=Hydra vulgaris TaxID=6087 RepID=A0ABM4CMA4_HYDVU
MSITENALYGNTDGRQKHSFSQKEFLNDYIIETLSSKRKADEIDKLKLRLKEKSILLEKANTFKKKKVNSLKVSRKLNKQLGLHEVPKCAKYIDFLPLHSLWLQYIKSNFNSVTLKADEKLLRIDFHGAEIKVRNSKCKSYIGLKGIVVKETKNIFVIITKNDEVKRIPKSMSIFELKLNNFLVKIAGDAICVLPSIRASKKFKSTNKVNHLLIASKL